MTTHVKGIKATTGDRFALRDYRRTMLNQRGPKTDKALRIADMNPPSEDKRPRHLRRPDMILAKRELAARIIRKEEQELVTA